VTNDLLAARTCRAAAFTALVAGLLLALGRHWLACALVLWMAPAAFYLADRCYRTHARTRPKTRKDTTTA
jgi:membrane glycosyltransferase